MGTGSGRQPLARKSSWSSPSPASGPLGLSRGKYQWCFPLKSPETQEGGPLSPEPRQSPFSWDNFRTSDPTLQLPSNDFPPHILLKSLNLPPFPTKEVKMGEINWLGFLDGPNWISLWTNELVVISKMGFRSVWERDAWALDQS